MIKNDSLLGSIWQCVPSISAGALIETTDTIFRSSEALATIKNEFSNGCQKLIRKVQENYKPILIVSSITLLAGSVYVLSKRIPRQPKYNDIDTSDDLSDDNVEPSFAAYQPNGAVRFYLTFDQETGFQLVSPPSNLTSDDEDMLDSNEEYCICSPREEVLVNQSPRDVSNSPSPSVSPKAKNLSKLVTLNQAAQDVLNPPKAVHFDKEQKTSVRVPSD